MKGANMKHIFLIFVVLTCCDAASPTEAPEPPAAQEVAWSAPAPVAPPPPVAQVAPAPAPVVVAPPEPTAPPEWQAPECADPRWALDKIVEALPVFATLKGDLLRDDPEGGDIEDYELTIPMPATKDCTVSKSIGLPWEIAIYCDLKEESDRACWRNIIENPPDGWRTSIPRPDIPVTDSDREQYVRDEGPTMVMATPRAIPWRGDTVDLFIAVEISWHQLLIYPYDLEP